MKPYVKYTGLTLAALFVVSLLLCSGLGAPARKAVGASLAVSPPFSDYAVLQRDIAVPVFGTATDGTQITVSFNGQVKSTTAAGGAWMVALDPMAANTAPGDLVITGDAENVTLTGVQVGEVWVCSGQSNMVKDLDSCYEGEETAADAPNHNIMLFREESGGTPDGVVWTVSDATTAGDFSGVCYFFAHNLSHSLSPSDLPIGLIQAATVGTTIQTWTHYLDASGDQYDAMVAPLQPYAIRGVNWYQGESNTGDSDYYDHLVALIAEWRSDWGQGQFPFQIIQLHGSLNWATMREQQLQAWLDTSNTSMAVAVDLPPDGSMHPLTKRPIGDRLAMAARALWYGESGTESSGPLRDPASSYVQGSDVVIAWTHLGGGLVTGSEWQPGGDPVAFELAGSDGKYYAATAQIVGDTVVVSSGSVPNPESVRYVWDFADGNIYNTDNLPASPFEMTIGAGPTPTPSATPTEGPTPTPSDTPPPTDTPAPTNTPVGGTNLALNQPVEVSSFQDEETTGAMAVDGSLSTYWRTKKRSSLPSEWIKVDLGSTCSVARVVLEWEDFWATTYTVQVSENGSDWSTVYSTSSGDGGTDDLNFDPASARYVMMDSTGWMNSTERNWMYEIEVYGEGGPTDTPAPPTDTPIPPTDTPEPPTDTPGPPTDTPVPPTDTPIPPTDTPAPPTDTPLPTDTPAPTNTPGGGGTIFFDGFEDGDMSDWTRSDTSAQIRTDLCYEGSYCAGTKLGAYFERTISTVGYTGIHFKVACATKGMDAGESLRVEWYDGSTWHLLEDILSNDVYVYRDWTLPAGAADNADFCVRFTGLANKNTEWGYADNVEVTGE